MSEAPDQSANSFQTPPAAELQARVDKLTDVVQAAMDESAVKDAEITRLRSENSELEAKNQELTEKAYTDKLTGIGNRAALDEKLPELIEMAKGSGAPMACFIVDAEGLKRVNERFGYRAGDNLIVTVARALKKAGISTDLIARLGGDEVALIAPDFRPTEGHSLQDIIDETYVVINQTITQGVEHYGLDKEVYAGASIGFSMLNQNDNGSEMLASADRDLGAAKRQRKDKMAEQGVVFDPADDRQIQRASGA